MIQSFKRGSLIGMVSGAMMAMFAMIAAAATGDGFWAPVNAIAHTVWRGAPLDGTISFGALALGMLIHMATAMMLGVVIVAGVARSSTRSMTVMAATGVAVAAWLVQIPIWSAIDSPGAHSFHRLILFAGHLIFGMTAGLLVSRAAQHHSSPAVPGALTPA